MTAQTDTLCVEMEEVRRRFEDWRSTHARRAQLPESLWAEAVALARTQGLFQTARALRLDGAPRPVDLPLAARLRSVSVDPDGRRIAPSPPAWPPPRCGGWRIGSHRSLAVDLSWPRLGSDLSYRPPFRIYQAESLSQVLAGKPAQFTRIRALGVTRSAVGSHSTSCRSC